MGWPSAVLLDCDGTLIRDVAYNADPRRVEPLPGVREALDSLRALGIPLAVVTNQSGVAKGLISRPQLRAVHRRLRAILGPFRAIVTCPHDDDDRCSCRKPRPGLLLRAARRLRVDLEDCVMIGDSACDVDAAQSVGIPCILVPGPTTAPADVDRADLVAVSFAEAVRAVRAAAPAILSTVHRGPVEFSR